MAEVRVEEIVKQYRELKSPYEIAQNLNTTAGIVRRTLQKAGEPLRNRSEAQAAALQSGRKTHPTRGRGHTDATKQRISESNKGKVRAKKD